MNLRLRKLKLRQDFQKERENKMKLHDTTIKRIISLVDTYGGSTDQKKLIVQLKKIDLTPYEQKLSAGGSIVLVPTDDYENALRNIK